MTNEKVAEWMLSLVHEGAKLRLDSREVLPGDIFCAIPGTKADGRTFIRVAEARGAAGVIYETDGSARAEHYPLASLGVANLHERLGAIAALFYGDPSAKLMGVAVTGTNGKTTTTTWLSQLLTKLGAPCGVIGTVGNFFNGKRIPGPHLTTPDAISLEGIYAQLVAEGAKAFAVEASSEGLLQGRLSGSHIRVGMFTNLSRDHLDFHHTMEAYADAKAILFSWPGMEAAVVNAADPVSVRFAALARKNGTAVWVCGREGAARAFAEKEGAAHWLDARAIRPAGHGQAFTLSIDGQDHEVSFPAIGTFNVDNVIEVIASAVALGFDAAETVRHVAALEPPPGRMQPVAAEGMPLGIVDFCHTPDALEKTIESLIPGVRARGGRLWTVFGCGGDRDSGKRPIMGGIAARLADEVVITSDNPRTEDPEAIVAAIAAGCAGAKNVRTITDRREAIHRAVLEAAPEDLILVAGKGHESEQILADGPHHFLDAEVLREAFNERRASLFRARS
ncbi:MAG: UDP-N-acetylmuramoyl-L-alanyl-D-glutamate--2,6-diaminopimelate ligase [Sutterella sp.]|nr:UDP-N-acetylmuramoyl-L-alanyl-D-glutamate--2,6-diaminopimelate ligase [Sutterella sp.]